MQQYGIRPEGIQPCNLKNRDIYWRRYKIQATLYIGQWHSVLFKVGTLGPHRSLLMAAHTHSTLSAVPLVAGLPEREWLSTESWPSLKSLCHTFICPMHIASSLNPLWIIQMVSVEVCSSLRQNLMQICCCTQSYWMWWPHSTHAHSTAFTAPLSSAVKLIVHVCAFQSTLLGCQVTLTWWELFLLY